MADKILTLWTVVCVVVAGVTSQDRSVCNEYKPSPSDPVRPTIPPYYSVHTEANILNRHYTSTYHEYFDGANNRSAVHTTTANLKTQDIYSFNTNELFHINEDTGMCSLQKLSTASTLWMFGKPDATGNARMYTASGSFHFGAQRNETHVNKTTVRGIKCDLWRSCQYWPELNATMILDWYFSDPNWQTANVGFQVPVRAHVYGKTWTNGMPRKFDHIYEFADFSSTPPTTLSTVFETPDGAFCPQRKNTKPLPTPAAAFHFTAEILQVDLKQITMIKEYYDFDLNLVRYDFVPTSNTPYGTNKQTQVHDFSTGIAYTIDDVRGNCTATNISGVGFDARNTDPTHVRMRTSKEFFYFDKTSYTYEGTKTVRDIQADVWIAQRTDWPSANSPTSTWQWYFAKPQYVANIADQLQFGLPVRLTVQSPRGHYIYNIYDYDEQKPQLWSYDISRCYNNTERKDFSISLNGNYQTVVSTHLERFKYSVIQSITKAASNSASLLTPLRINNIQVDYTSGTSIVVTFTILDKSPPIGDVNNPKVEADLKTVSTRISAAINSGQFIVRLNAPSMKQAVFMTATAYTMTPTQRVTVQNGFVQAQVQQTTSSTGASGGTMAGMGVGLLVVFFILGVLGMYIFYRQQGGAFLPKKFGAEGDITNST